MSGSGKYCFTAIMKYTATLPKACGSFRSARACGKFSVTRDLVGASRLYFFGITELLVVRKDAQ